MNVIAQLSATLRRQASRPFLIDADTETVLSYSEASGLALRLADHFESLGLCPGDRIVMLLGNSPAFAVAYLACAFRGFTAVPVNAALHISEIRFILERAGASLVICSEVTGRLLDATASSGMSRMYLPSIEDIAALPCDSTARQPFDRTSPDALFSITFTSGTTNRPKGVAHRLGTLLANADAFNRHMGFDASRRFLHVLPMAYMAGFLNTLLSPLMAGATVILARPFDAQSVLRFWKPVMQHRVDTFWLTPTMLEALLRADRDSSAAEYCRQRVRTVCVGTAPLALRTKRQFESRYGIELFESYGLSELLLVSGNTSSDPRVAGSVGPILPGVDIRTEPISDEQHAATGDGELQIRTPYRMVGYLDEESGTPDARGASDWFATGDIGHVDEAGRLFITARSKDLIIRGGTNISPRAVEEALLDHEAVSDVAVVGYPHAFYGEEVVAVLQMKEDRLLDIELPSLRSLCQARLSTAAVPARFIAFDCLPRSVTGKVQKHKIREQLLRAHSPSPPS